MSDLFYQCKMTRPDIQDSTEVTVGWIEARGAKVGLQVELLELPQPEKFWTVAEVWGKPLEKAALQAKQAADRKGLPSIGRVVRV